MFNCPSQTTNGDADDRQSSSPIEAVRAANEEVSKVCDNCYLEVSNALFPYSSSICTIYHMTISGILGGHGKPISDRRKIARCSKKRTRILILWTLLAT